MTKPLEIGQFAERERRFVEKDMQTLRGIAGVGTPRYRVNEALINGMFSDLLGVELPGAGTNYLKQETEFSRLPKIGEKLVARVEITRLRPDKHLVDLETTCRGHKGELIATGRALVLAKDVEGAFA